jgi:MOSC domain-containing protein YiiM
MAGAVLLQLNTSPGGMPKLPVARALVSKDGVAGDRQKNRKYHGGPDRAVCLFSVELYDWLRTEGIDLANGSVGENFTTRGIDLTALAPGRRLRVGQCLIEITDVRTPCRSLHRWEPRLMKLMKGRSGWVAKVVGAAEVAAGDPITVL